MTKSIFIFLLFLQCNMMAQVIDPIEADRPDQTETPAIVPKGMFQTEAGFTIQKENNGDMNNNLLTVLWKYGLNDNIELRLITELLFEKNEFEKSNGITPTLLGLKVKITDEKGIIPQTSLIAHLLFPNWAFTKYKANFFAPDFRFVMKHTVSNKVSLSYNLGAEWDGFTPNPTFLYTITTGYAFTNKLGGYVEFFGFAPQNYKSNHNFDGGFTYLINNNFMVDLSSGIGITKNAMKHYFNFGFSIRI